MNRTWTMAALVAAMSTLFAERAPAASDHTCVGQQTPDAIAPWGVDINLLYGYCGYIARPLGFPHSEVPTGAWWAPAFDGWHTNTAYSSAYLAAVAGVDPSFQPDPGGPIADFENKLVAVTFIIDAGTSHEARYSEEPEAIIARALTSSEFGPIAGFDPLGVGAEPPQDLPDGSAALVANEPNFPNDAFFPYLGPLPPGTHTITVVWTMSANHWDGITIDPAYGSQLVKGDNVFLNFPFEVVNHDD